MWQQNFFPYPNLDSIDLGNVDKYKPDWLSLGRGILSLKQLMFYYENMCFIYPKTSNEYSISMKTSLLTLKNEQHEEDSNKLKSIKFNYS